MHLVQAHSLICQAVSVYALAGLVGGVILSLIWMFVLRYAAGVMAWTAVIAVNVLLAGCTLLAFAKVLEWCLPA
jgi:solute carrier family 44 (choline transporter-like protein), member 2/4/5